MFVVDTNILVYAADAGSPFHDRSRTRLEEWRRRASAWYVTWGVLYEFVRVTTHRAVLVRPWSSGEAWSFVQALLASPGLDVLTETPRHASVVDEVFGELPHLAGNIVHDAHTAVLMREHGLKVVYSRDTDFHRFPFLEPLDPTL